MFEVNPHHVRFYNEFFARAATSKAHARLCERAYGRDLCQHGMMDMAQLDQIYGLFIDRPGNFVKKPMRACTGEEIAREWLYQLGAGPVEHMAELAATSARCAPCMMPFITTFFLPRRAGDWPAVVPQHVVKSAFIGQFAETARYCVRATDVAGDRDTAAGHACARAAYAAALGACCILIMGWRRPRSSGPPCRQPGCC
jgi:MCRA family